MSRVVVNRLDGMVNRQERMVGRLDSVVMNLVTTLVQTPRFGGLVPPYARRFSVDEAEGKRHGLGVDAGDPYGQDVVRDLRVNSVVQELAPLQAFERRIGGPTTTVAFHGCILE